MAQAISKKETTAVEWLMKQIGQNLEMDIDAVNKIIKQAKAMEKEQIVDAFYEGMQANTFDPNKGRALMYYNITYNK